ncbi:MAG: acetyl-CoA hydrolase/transferase family protein [Variovorax sp.]|nr:MAG: acetyl-CoA hydrolase/transferase family protein [Variovorax sp.]
MIVLDRIEDIDFTTLVCSGDTVVCAQGLAEPVSLTRRLVEQRSDIGAFNVFLGASFSNEFRPEHADAITFRSYCGTGANAALSAATVLDIVPAHYSDLPRLFTQGTLRSDVVLLSVGEPDAAGRFNLGLANDYVVDAARRARLVIAEVSDRMPWVYGAELPADIQPHIVVRTGREPLTLERGQGAGEVERALAERVSALIPDGATLELGIGVLPDLVLQALRGHKDLGIHTGVIGDSVVDLMEAGVITNARKPFDLGISVAGLLLGGRRLFDFAHRNAQIRLAPPGQTHDAAALRSIPSLMAVNCAIEIDLTGQVNAESLNGRYIGAIGGQVDFGRGANGASGGRSIMLLPSTGRNGTVSRIVTTLADHAVTTPRSDVDVVVTEHGVAELRGKSLPERVKALTAIAHPDFREGLARSGHGLARSVH